MQRLFITALACLICFSTLGQHEIVVQKSKKWNFGISLGSNLSNTVDVTKYPPNFLILGEPTSKLVDFHKNKLGVSAGGFCKWRDINNSFFYTEINYTQKGSHSNHENLWGPYKSNINYLAFCQSVAYKPFNNTIYVFTGVEVSYLLSYKHIYLDNNYDNTECLDVLQAWDDINWTDSYNYRRFDFGLISGILYEHVNSNFAFSLKYTHGLISMLPIEITFYDDTGTTIGTGRVKVNVNRLLNFNIHYTFN